MTRMRLKDNGRDSNATALLALCFLDQHSSVEEIRRGKQSMCSNIPNQTATVGNGNLLPQIDANLTVELKSPLEQKSASVLA